MTKANVINENDIKNSFECYINKLDGLSIDLSTLKFDEKGVIALISIKQNKYQHKNRFTLFQPFNVNQAWVKLNFCDFKNNRITKGLFLI